MVSFLKKIFGGSGNSEGGQTARPAEGEPYRDCVIFATPVREGSQWRLAGSITKDVDGETKERTFVRADLFSSEEEARSFAVTKAQQIIDQNGRQLFAGDKTGTA